MQNKNLRKALAVSMAIAMTGGLLAGCGNSSSGGSSNSGTTNSGSTSSASGELDTSEFVELSMYVISDRPSGQDEIDENLNKLLKEKLNCSLKINWIGWAEYANKYPLLFSSGEEFDMAYSASWLNFASLAQKGAFKSLDELWPTYAPKNFAAQSEEAKQQATVNGSYYCVPSLLSTYNTYGPFWRGDLVEGTDWDGKMETFEDIEEYCDIIKETHPEMECIDLYSTQPEIFYMYMENQGLAAFNGIRYLWYDPSAENPTVMTSYELEKTPEFLEMMARTLGLSLEEMSIKGLEWKENIVISSMCTVFAESEVVSLVAQNKNVADIIHGLNVSVASKVGALAARLGKNNPGEYMMTGGVAKNQGIIKALEEKIGAPLYICDEAQLCGALGAALFAFEKCREGR